VHWSDDPQAVKIAYLVGDAPPHYDYKDGLTMSGVLAEAKQRGIHISAIRCGDDTTTLAAWRQIASETKATSRRSNSRGRRRCRDAVRRGARAPERLAGADRGSLRTDSERRALDADTGELEAPAIAQRTERRSWGRGASAKPMKQDLVAGKGALAHVSESALPADLRAMDPGARESFVEGKRRSVRDPGADSRAEREAGRGAPARRRSRRATRSIRR